jgi:hypothetical protein
MNTKEEVEKMLSAWDSGDTVWSIELGGFGPGYEQAIQVAAIEFARATKDLEGLKNDDKESTALFTATCEQVVEKHDKALGGLTGAQFGAARYLAWNWVVNGGPARLIERAKEQGKCDQAILVSKAWPHIEAAA